MANGVRLHVDLSKMAAKVDLYNEENKRKLAAAVDYQATRSEAWMKSNAPWTDQTTNARNGLFTRVSKRGTNAYLQRFQIIFSHTVNYGIWLEVKYSGRYAVIVPALEQAQREFPQLLRKLF